MRIYGLGQSIMDDYIGGAQAAGTFDPSTDPTYATQSAATLPASTTGLTPTASNFLTTGVLPANVGSSSSSMMLIGLAVVGVVAFIALGKR